MRDEAVVETGRWRSWLWLALAASGMAALIVALVLWLASANRARDAALDLQSTSSERIILAATFDATMARSEAALGRFVISGDRALGTLYSDNWNNSGVLLDRLEAAARDDATQQVRVADLRKAWKARGAELAETAIRTSYRQNSEALATYYRIRTSPALDRLNALTGAVIGHERAVLGRRTTAADARTGRSNTLTTIVSVIGIVLVAGAALLAFVGLRAAQRRRREEARSEELEEAVAERTAELSAANERLVDEMATREAAEARLRQAQKMDAVGQLTGGIAHDFNNMLAVVLGGVELAKRRIDDGKGDPGRYLDSAMEGANRAAALTKRLLAFARAEPLLPSATDADALIGGMSDLLDRTLGERIAVRHLARAGDWPIFADRHQLENALLNLAVNARDAMEGGGTLTVATAQVTVGSSEIAELAPGDYVRIAVSDTGTGIERAVLDRIFEPFFTTKETGKGTGLGLSQVFGYARQSSGTVTVDSVVGTGTTVSLYLPRHLGEAGAADADIADIVHWRPARPAKILVVEDDRRVLTATVDALHELGHVPVACLGPDDAAAQLRRHPDIDLLVSDVLMPGQTGPELAAALRTFRPDLKVVFVTGFTGDIASANAFGHDRVLRKPFTIGTLGVAIDATLSDVPTRVPTRALETRAAA
ncbi:ATP-binding protein [Sphingomonas sp. SUN039]|uniref:ATP-binding protein n=1 Tax=Sphingomonas sp. SUN039 TaxID=2937787 RepID=UPI00216415AD|nr:ATP-binding protein [Sphingomonas sp. SUN039]UVO54432.1 ATP-binding protein [Sphingomonas sp. SUN039]